MSWWCWYGWPLFSSELIGGTPSLKINHGSGTLVLQLPGNVVVSDRRWHRLDVRSNSKVSEPLNGYIRILKTHILPCSYLYMYVCVCAEIVTFLFISWVFRKYVSPWIAAPVPLSWRRRAWTAGPWPRTALLVKSEESRPIGTGTVLLRIPPLWHHTNHTCQPVKALPMAKIVPLKGIKRSTNIYPSTMHTPILVAATVSSSGGYN